MDKLLSTIHNFSGDDQTMLKQLQAELKKQEDNIAKNLHSVDGLLGNLEPSRHTLGYLFFLSAKAKVGVEPELFIKQATALIEKGQARQIRLEPRKFKTVCQKFADVCRESKQPIRALKPLKTSIWKVGGQGDHLTPQHAMYVQMCILAKNYKAAQQVLDKFVFEIDPDVTGVESVHSRLYFYYGGIAYIGLKQFAKALEFFEIVISAPAFVASAIMVEAYKKYVLVSLIHKGEVGSLPRYTNTQLVRVFKQMAQAYEDLSTSFSTRAVADLHKVAQNHFETFSRDGNMGLVKQAIQALTKQNVQRLTKTFLTLSSANIAEQVSLQSPAETEKLVFKMIQDGEVFAKINQKDGMVEFYENPEQYNNNKTLDYLDRQLQNSITLTKEVSSIDERIGLDQRYLQKVLQSERSGGAGGPGGRFPTGMGDDDDMGMIVDGPQAGGPGGFRG